MNGEEKGGESQGQRREDIKVGRKEWKMDGGGTNHGKGGSGLRVRRDRMTGRVKAQFKRR